MTTDKKTDLERMKAELELANRLIEVLEAEIGRSHNEINLLRARYEPPLAQHTREMMAEYQRLSREGGEE